MIRDVERYHGAVLARLIRLGPGGHTIRCHELGSSCYVVDEAVGLYVKYSAMRMSPWGFSFTDEHRQEASSLLRQVGGLCVALLCGEDGIVSLDSTEFGQVLDTSVPGVAWIRVARRRRERYSVSGSDGRLKLKVADSAFPAKLFVIAQMSRGVGTGSPAKT